MCDLVCGAAYHHRRIGVRELVSARQRVHCLDRHACIERTIVRESARCAMHGSPGGTSKQTA
jgi:hypothetical protein